MSVEIIPGIYEEQNLEQRGNVVLLNDWSGSMARFKAAHDAALEHWLYTACYAKNAPAVFSQRAYSQWASEPRIFFTPAKHDLDEVWYSVCQAGSE